MATKILLTILIIIILVFLIWVFIELENNDSGYDRNFDDEEDD